jgi:hypothetical protein
MAAAAATAMPAGSGTVPCIRFLPGYRPLFRRGARQDDTSVWQRFGSAGRDRLRCIHDNELRTGGDDRDGKQASGRPPNIGRSGLRGRRASDRPQPHEWSHRRERDDAHGAVGPGEEAAFVASRGTSAASDQPGAQIASLMESDASSPLAALMKTTYRVGCVSAFGFRSNPFGECQDAAKRGRLQLAGTSTSALAGASFGGWRQRRAHATVQCSST